MRTAAIILAALNLDLWYSIKKECINSTTVTTALMSKEVLCLALLTWLMENSISVWSRTLWWERQVSWIPEAPAKLHFFPLLLANFPAFFGPGHGKGKTRQLTFLHSPERKQPNRQSNEDEPFSSSTPVQFQAWTLHKRYHHSGPNLNSKFNHLQIWRSPQAETQSKSWLQDKDFLACAHSPSRLQKYWIHLWWILKIAPFL